MAVSAVDNDILLKAISYGLEQSFWPPPDSHIRVLGAARYVITDRLSRTKPGRADAHEALEKLLESAEELEPSDEELGLATKIESCALDLGLELDSGESQLAAMVVKRNIALLETGDKRAVAGLETLITMVAGIGDLREKVRCLEQIAYRLASEAGKFPQVASAICAEADIDKSLAVCFSCYTRVATKQDTVLRALQAYIEDLRAQAPSILEPGP